MLTYWYLLCLMKPEYDEDIVKHENGGGLALQPYIDYLPLSMDKAALRAMVQALAPSLKERGIYIGTVQVTGRIGSNEHFSPKTIAEKFWELYERQETHEIVY